ncbi:hypothetical protein PoB_004731100 [Plakobranchus ocellatus]|uniref:Uncharacterized protein n=1 Tax=Plakobranchus ocellatus TaxID=259542 RepID=A0AAV4BP85_9GAST|nr:hypothetical protein PoB_004731100 [Plakobranchus ocellatus]
MNSAFHKSSVNDQKHVQLLCILGCPINKLLMEALMVCHEQRPSGQATATVSESTRVTQLPKGSVGGRVDSEFVLRFEGTLLSRIRAPPPASWSNMTEGLKA